MDDLQRSLGNIEGQLTLLIASFNEYKSQQKEDLKEIEKRVTHMEIRINRAAAVVGFVMFVVTFAGDFLLTKVGLKT